MFNYCHGLFSSISPIGLQTRAIAEVKMKLSNELDASNSRCIKALRKNGLTTNEIIVKKEV